MSWEAKAARIGAAVATGTALALGARGEASSRRVELQEPTSSGINRIYPDIVENAKAKLAGLVRPIVRIGMPGGTLLCRPLQDEGLFEPADDQMPSMYGDCSNPRALLQAAATVNVFGVTLPVPGVLK